MLSKVSSIIAVASLAPIVILVLSSSAVRVNAFSGLSTSSSSTLSISNRGHSLCHLKKQTLIDNEFSSAENSKTDRSIIAPFWPTREQQDALQTFSSTFRLSMFLLFSLPATMAPSLLVVEPALAADDSQGMSVVTQSSLGTSVRKSVVQSAKLVDAADLKWERFSDSLRDNKKCDPLTNRRLFDNGIRSDGTPRGNPVLGALCDPVPLKSVDENLVDRVLGGALADAAIEAIGGAGKTDDPASLQQLLDQTRVKVKPAFERAFVEKSSSEATDEARKRQNYNLETYSRVRAYGEALTTSISTAAQESPLTQQTSSPAPSKPRSKASLARQAGKKLDLLWGRNLLDRLAGPATTKYEFVSPFPKPSSDIPFPYDAKQLTNALGAIEVALQKLQDGGLIGHWEISIPEDDYGEVVTIAVDDDVCIGAQILAREENSVLSGSPVVAMVRSALADRAQIPYTALDVFFIDPTTTKNELYNPTQLLISIRNLGEEP